jgi:hypothetical protein
LCRTIVSIPAATARSSNSEGSMGRRPEPGCPPCNAVNAVVRDRPQEPGRIIAEARRGNDVLAKVRQLLTSPPLRLQFADGWSLDKGHSMPERRHHVRRH